MSPEPAHLLVVAASGRALAQAAARAGYRVTTVDGFGDIDTRNTADETIVCRFDRARDLRRAVDTALTRRRYAGCVYGGGLESHPEVVRQLARETKLWGNPATTLAHLSDARSLLRLLDEYRIPHPESRIDAPPPGDSGWLRKHAGSCGGQAVNVSPPAALAIGPGAYWQRKTAGRAHSLLFAANGRDLRIVGWNELLPAAAAGDYRYRGAVGHTGIAVWQQDLVVAAAGSLVAALGLRGLNGVDFIVADDAVLVIDINPRPTATMELHDTCKGRLIAAHIAACVDQALPVLPPVSPPTRGHRVCYVSHGGQVGRRRWPRWCTDRPAAGTGIKAGEALCTVHAEGGTRDLVMATLTARAQTMDQTWSLSAVQAKRACA